MKNLEKISLKLLKIKLIRTNGLSLIKLMSKESLEMTFNAYILEL